MRTYKPFKRSVFAKLKAGRRYREALKRKPLHEGYAKVYDGLKRIK